MRHALALAALLASSMPDAASITAPLALRRSANDGPAPVPTGFGYQRIGKGKGKRPHHSSARFVAQDKRDARKARNRRTHR